MITLTEKAKETIKEELEFYIEAEGENLKATDMVLILFVRKQSCSPMTEGGHKEIGVGVGPFQKYSAETKYSEFEILEEIENLPVFIEKEARDMLKETTSIEIDSRGALEKELIIRNGPVIDLGSCSVTFKRPQ